MRPRVRHSGILLAVLLSLATGLPSGPGASAVDAYRVGEWRISPWLGWEWGDMKAVDEELTVIAAQAQEEFVGGLAAWGETAQGTITQRTARGGVGFGCELGRRLTKRIGASVRAGMVRMTGEEARYDGTGSSGEVYHDAWFFDHSLTVVMVGLWGEGGDPDGLSWRGAVFVGPGYADSSFEQRGRFIDPLSSTDMSWDGRGRLTGSTLAFEAAARASLQVSEGLLVFAEAGYLAAEVEEMRWRSDVDVDGDGSVDYRGGTVLLSNRLVPAGGLPSEQTRLPLPFDFSGLRLRVGITVRFGRAAVAGPPEVPGS